MKAMEDSGIDSGDHNGEADAKKMVIKGESDRFGVSTSFSHFDFENTAKQVSGES